jgi:hypothetical protein
MGGLANGNVDGHIRHYFLFRRQPRRRTKRGHDRVGWLVLACSTMDGQQSAKIDKASQTSSNLPSGSSNERLPSHSTVCSAQSRLRRPKRAGTSKCIRCLGGSCRAGLRTSHASLMLKQASHFAPRLGGLFLGPTPPFERPSFISSCGLGALVTK